MSYAREGHPEQQAAHVCFVDGMLRDSLIHNYPPRWNAASSQKLLVHPANRRSLGRTAARSVSRVFGKTGKSQRQASGLRTFAILTTDANELVAGIRIDGSDVERYFLDGRIKEIANYCETDVVNTYRVWLRYELFRGRLTESEHEASERNLAEYIKARSNTKPHLNPIQESSV